MNAIKAAIGAVTGAIGSVVGGLWGLVQRHPVRAQALAQATIGVATAFGLGWTAEQVAAVMALSAAALAFVTESAVTPIAQPVVPAGTPVTAITPEGTPDRVVMV